MESPPPAVFHDKYERTQQGNLLPHCRHHHHYLRYNVLRQQAVIIISIITIIMIMIIIIIITRQQAGVLRETRAEQQCPTRCSLSTSIDKHSIIVIIIMMAKMKSVIETVDYARCGVLCGLPSPS